MKIVLKDAKSEQKQLLFKVFAVISLNFTKIAKFIRNFFLSLPQSSLKKKRIFVWEFLRKKFVSRKILLVSTVFFLRIS